MSGMAAVSVSTAPVLGSTLSTRSSWPDTGCAGQGSAPTSCAVSFTMPLLPLTLTTCPSVGTSSSARAAAASARAAHWDALALSALVRCAAVWACAALAAVEAALAAARCAAVEALLELSSTRATNCSYSEGGSSSASSSMGRMA